MGEQETVPEVIPGQPEEQVKAAIDPWSDIVATRRVRQNFEYAENYRRRAHDWRWSTADRLYLGWMKQKFWEGTKVPRSSLPVYLTLEHVESILPKFVNTLFGETYWFDARPYPGIRVEEARAVQEMILAQARGVNNGTGIRAVFRRAGKSAFIYGNGIVYLGWKRSVEQRAILQDELIPQVQNIQLPGGMNFPVPTGKNVRRITETVQEVEINEPDLEYVSLRQFYIDPHCPSPFPWEAAYACRRKLVSISKLLKMDGNPNISLPAIPILLGLAQQTPTTSADISVRNTEAMRDISYNPTDTYSVAGEDKRVELLEYWTQDRLIWMLGRKRIIYNQPNPYGFIPFFNIYYVDVLDRFYSLAMSDVLEPEQRLQEGVINLRMDELSLGINRHTVKKRGTGIPNSQLRQRPGLVTEADNPKDDVVIQDVPNITQQAFLEVAASEARSQRRDGITELAVLGTPGTGSSVNRTATGIQTQATAALSRIGYIIENCQEEVIVPLLDKWLFLNQKFNTQQQLVEFMGSEGEVIQLDAGVILRANIKFEMRASNKSNSRAAMLSVMPIVVQSLLNPVLMEMLHAEGKTVDVNEIVNIILDATNYRPHKLSLIRALTPEETQALSQSQIDQTKLLTQKTRGDTQLEITQEREAAALVREIMEDITESRVQEAELRAASKRPKSKAN